MKTKGKKILAVLSITTLLFGEAISVSAGTAWISWRVTIPKWQDVEVDDDTKEKYDEYWDFLLTENTGTDKIKAWLEKSNGTDVSECCACKVSNEKYRIAYYSDYKTRTNMDCTLNLERAGFAKQKTVAAGKWSCDE